MAEKPIGRSIVTGDHAIHSVPHRFCARSRDPMLAYSFSLFIFLSAKRHII